MSRESSEGSEAGAGTSTSSTKRERFLRGGEGVNQWGPWINRSELEKLERELLLDPQKWWREIRPSVVWALAAVSFWCLTTGAAVLIYVLFHVRFYWYRVFP
jgi:hypothetical protein